MRNAAKTLNLQWPHSRTEEEWGNNLIYDGDLNNIWRSHESGIEHDVYKKSRNSIKIGKLINKLFPGKYNDKQIEEFVNKFKSTLEQSGERFIGIFCQIDHCALSASKATKKNQICQSCFK